MRSCMPCHEIVHAYVLNPSFSSRFGSHPPPGNHLRQCHPPHAPIQKPSTPQSYALFVIITSLIVKLKEQSSIGMELGGSGSSLYS
ncbi:hypothetical protein ACLOJK_026428 [Asimina triloba]